MDNLQWQLAIAGIINGLVQIIILIASIVLLVKKRSTATLLICIGSMLSSISLGGGVIYNAIAARKGTEAILDAQVNLNFFNAFSFLIFGIGLLMLAITHFKKNSTEIVN